MTLEQPRVPVSALTSVAGLRIVVTGGRAGIGQAIASGLGELGARVVTVDLTEPGDAGSPEHTGSALVADVSDERAVEDTFDAAVADLGGLDVVFANAGIAGHVAPLADWSLEQWRQVQSVNLDGAFLTARAALRRFSPGRGRKLVFTASVWGLRGSASAPCAGYSASKAGVIGLTRQLAADTAEAGTCVNAIAPSGFLTNIAGGMMHDADAAAPMLARQPRHTFVGPEAAVGTAAYLASAASDHVTGHVLALEGGYLAV